jgi:RNA polymerase sigma-B factor
VRETTETTVEKTAEPRGHPHPADLLLRRRAALPPADPTRHVLRHQAVVASLPAARSLARRYAGRGEPLDDIQQVAFVGLLKAVDGFDPAYCTDFWAYATPTIRGEIKRYFRDKSWAVEVPRRYKNLQQEVNRCRDDLAQRLRRFPRVADYAEHLGTDHDEIRQAIVAANGYSSASLSAQPGGTGTASLTDRLGEQDPGFELVDLHESIHPALARLPHRERQIVTLRYFGNMTQTQIAAEVGISQMHVSRLLARSLKELRRCLSGG